MIPRDPGPPGSTTDTTKASTIGVANRPGFRKEHGSSQGELAEHVGGDAHQISRYENGRITPSLDAVVRIAEVLNVSIDYLVIDDARAALSTWPTTGSQSASACSTN